MCEIFSERLHFCSCKIQRNFAKFQQMIQMKQIFAIVELNVMDFAGLSRNSKESLNLGSDFSKKKTSTRLASPLFEKSRVIGSNFPAVFEQRRASVQPCPEGGPRLSAAERSHFRLRTPALLQA